MRTLSANFDAHLREGYRCWCLLIETLSGEKFGFTSTINPLTIDGVTYDPTTGITPSQYRADLRTEPASSSFDGFFSTDIKEVDLLSGSIDGAIATLFVCSWLNPPSTLNMNTALILSVGTLGKATSTDRGYRSEFLSAEVKLSRSRRKTTQPSCRATLGDSECAVNLSQYQFNGQVSAQIQGVGFRFSVISQNSKAEPKTTHFYRNGYVVFTTGQNAGQRFKISEHNDTNRFELLDRPLYPLDNGDRFLAVVGCDKTLTECHEKFSNSDNFRGEPFVPGPDSLVRSPN